MVKLSVILCLLASAVLASSEPAAPVEEMALAQPESSDKASTGIVEEVVATLSGLIHNGARVLREAESGPNRPRNRPRRRRPRSRPNSSPEREPNHSPSHTRDLDVASDLEAKETMGKVEATAIETEEKEDKEGETLN